MDTVTVALGARSYPIRIDAGLLAQPHQLGELLAGDSALVVTNETVAPLYLAALTASLRAVRTSHVVLPDGEEHKTLENLDRIYTALLERGHDRHTTIFGLGGGVVGDLAGLAAATYQRGVHLVQVPTTLLAQVDASVGGKTGVNHRLGKNMIGAFHQPRGVLVDTDTLASLPERELRAGLAEVIKYGLICDAELFAWLEANLESLLARDAEALRFAIRRSCENKAAVVALDEREATDARALLNLGHTFAHAIETGLGYGRWLHGEAVGCGMVMAAELSQALGWLAEEDAERVRALLARTGLPMSPPPELTRERFLELMARDKKSRAGRLRLVLLRGLGRAVVSEDFAFSALDATLRARCAA